MYTTKTTLINKLANGDDHAWQEFEKIYRNLMFSVMLKQGVPVSDADDIIQIVMLALFNNGRFNYSRERCGKFRTYLGGILRHKIADYFSSRKKQSLLLVDEHTEYELPDFESVYLAEYRRSILTAAVNELKQQVSPEYFEAFQLCILQELPDKKAADILGEKPNTITVRKKRCNELLKKIISTFDDECSLELPFI